tara:strand:+ start:818 stop:1417 length:600 start_codon:yes stop_codon:yes gene_type:complete
MSAIMSEMINNSQWAKYEAKYGGLMHTIARKISGDAMVASYEDNRSDLQVAAVESIIGYKKKTGKDFDEAFGTKLFDQYTKTVLWNRKAKKGIPLTKRMKFRKKHKTIYNKEGELFVIEDPSSVSGYASTSIETLFEESNDDVKKLVDTIIDDPSVVTEDGKLKGYTLANTTGMSIHFVRRALENITQTLERAYGKSRD